MRPHFLSPGVRPIENRARDIRQQHGPRNSHQRQRNHHRCYERRARHGDRSGAGMNGIVAPSNDRGNPVATRIGIDLRIRNPCARRLDETN